VRWSCEENIKYCHFLYKHQQIFESEHLRKQERIFLLLSNYIQTRDTSRVKSHHQKMIKRHLHVQNIIRFMEKKYKTNVLNSNTEE
jgi:hypothetical protein